MNHLSPVSLSSNSQPQLPRSRRSRSRDSGSMSLPSTPASPSSSGSSVSKLKKLWSKTKGSSRSIDDDASSYSGNSNTQRRSVMMIDERGRSIPPGSFMNNINIPPTVPPKGNSSITTTHIESRTPKVGVVSVSALEGVVITTTEQQDRKGSIATVRTTTTTTTATAAPPPPRVSSLIGSGNENMNPMELAKERMNFLEEKLRSTEAELAERSNEFIELLRKDQQSVTKIAELQETLSAAEQKASEDATVLNQQDERIERLRAQIAEVASKKALPGASSDQTNLRVAEPEIIKMWQSFSWKVHNFVWVYLKSLGERKIKSWTDEQGDKLAEVTPYYNQFALDKKASLWFIEAAIWNVLVEKVFAHGNACWAGKYGRNLGKLSLSLLSAIEQGPKYEDQTRRFHHWKSVTTGLLASLSTTNSTKINESRQQVLYDVTEALEDLFEPFGGRIGAGELRELQDIVKEAVALDEVFSGQQSWYQVHYPQDKRHDLHIDINTMEPATGSSSSSRTVRFVIRPGLWRAGGTGREERYDAWFVLVHSLVWT
ncbi:hypothetical protein QBC43DRAFT_222375 [Cladorrhinum sp. PSN259]|nr:hypothetical protein QBC43DRAFT_222375 [Cladorrhinum sp. PSN259]